MKITMDVSKSSKGKKPYSRNGNFKYKKKTVNSTRTEIISVLLIRVVE